MADASADYDLSSLPTVADLRARLATSRDPAERLALKDLLFVDTYGAGAARLRELSKAIPYEHMYGAGEVD